ncbi:MAG TPA: PadR family transcriptional regulator [Bryobacteraceae bacterium]|nr:PadR family transcriptional regulator [Bryobacteraceae bacterium]
MREDLNSFLPLSPATLHILLSLAGEDRHGYGIMREVARQSEGKYKMGPGTLYDNLQKLLDRALVEETSSRPADDDPRRRYYRLSQFGRRILSAEISRLEGVVKEARLHLKPSASRSE